MSKSNCEEIIGILWFILGLMLFDRNYIILGIIALWLGVLASICSLVYAFQYNKIFKQLMKQLMKQIKEKKG